MDKLSFKERVAEAANQFAPIYKRVFVDYEYLLCSDAFSEQDYYIIDAKADNFKHLLGIHTELSPILFYQKCLNGELTADDFDFLKWGESEKGVKGTVRRKIKAFPSFLSMMNKDLVAQEKFEKNKVFCAIATTDCESTAGFINSTSLRPKTLLGGDQIDWSIAGTVDLILRRPTGSALFCEVVMGDDSAFMHYFERIAHVVSADIRPKNTG